MGTAGAQYAVIITDHGIEFPGVPGDSTGNPLVLGEDHVIGIDCASKETAVVNLIGGVSVFVPHDLIIYNGEQQQPPTRFRAIDDEAFFDELSKAVSVIDPNNVEKTFQAWADDFELASLLAKILSGDRRVHIDVSSLIARLERTLEHVGVALMESVRFAELAKVLDSSRTIYANSARPPKVTKKPQSTPASSPDKLYVLGCKFRDSGNFSKAAELFRKAAELGNPDAQNCLGVCYECGNGVKPDACMALGWYVKAARQDNAKALFNLGRCLENGIGCDDVDLPTAKECYTKSFELGHKDAEYRLWKVKELLKRRNQPETDTGIPWGSIAKGAAAVLFGGALAVADGLLNGTKGKSNRQ